MRRLRRLIALLPPSRARRGAAAGAQHAEEDREQGQQRRHEGDVHRAQPGLQPLDVAAQLELHGAKLLARAQDLLARAVYLGALLGGDDGAGGRLTLAAGRTLAQLAQAALGLFQDLLQLTLAGPELRPG
jgi:hypothetical protein